MTLDANLETIMLKNKLKTIIWNLTLFFVFKNSSLKIRVYI